MKKHQPWKERHQEPSKYKIGSWRWLLLDRKVPVRWSGAGGAQLPSGKQHGDLAYYTYVDLEHGIQTKFRRSYRAWYRFGSVHLKCGCERRVWKRKIRGMNPSCPTHGLFAKFGVKPPTEPEPEVSQETMW